MAKGQKRSNREAKKPKKEAVSVAPPALFSKGVDGRSANIKGPGGKIKP